VNDIIDTPEVATLLHASDAQIERLAIKGHIPATKIGRSWIYSREQIMDWIKEKMESDAESARRKLRGKTKSGHSALTLYPDAVNRAKRRQKLAQE
jgi:excisionase family DNA binding protein